MIHIIDRNNDYGLQVMRTANYNEASEFILEAGFPEAVLVRGGNCCRCHVALLQTPSRYGTGPP